MESSGHRWRPIAELDASDRAHTAPSVEGLAQAWRDERASMQETDVERLFLERWKNRLAVETGVLEGLYALDRGVTETLIERGFDSALIPADATDQEPTLVANLLRDQREAVDVVFDVVVSRRSLSTSFVKELHALLTASQPTTTAIDQFGRPTTVDLLRGEWKRLPNNPTRTDGRVHEYCPPEQVQPEMERLIELTDRYHADGVSPDVVAAWCHHRFTQIHPFQDGNGRVARLLATLIFIRSGWLPLVVQRDDRVRYLDALERADNGSLTELTGLFDRLQRIGFMQALSVAAQMQQDRDQLGDVLDAIRERLTSRGSGVPNGLDHLATQLRSDAREQMSEVGSELNQILQGRGARTAVWVDTDTDDTTHWYRVERIDLAHEFDYFADFTRYSHWVRLKIDLDGRFDILLSLTGVGRNTNAVAAVLGAWEVSRGGDDSVERRLVHVISQDPFTATGREEPGPLRERFGSWLRTDLARALALWQRGL